MIGLEYDFEMRENLNKIYETKNDWTIYCRFLFQRIEISC